ncbi:MAG: S1 RNA-binding domain-containing protein, partial [bacterium]|nr:S1 RNA-binding domain-containing protein [bacterium]
GFNPGEAVTARVLSTKGQYVIIDVGAKEEGIVPKEEFILDDGTLRAEEGESIKVWFVAMRQGNMTFTARNKAAGKGSEVLATAFAAGTPIDGLVKSEIKGGFEVEVAGVRGFCPASQMDLFRKDHPSSFVGTTQTFLITEYGEDDRGMNLLVSRRSLLERERKTMRTALFAALAEGQIREGTVTRLMDFGVFVDLGGAEGLVPMRELSWDRAVKAADLVKVGDKVEVLVQHFDVVTERISLSLRAMHQNPWDAFAAQYREGDTLQAKIVRMMTFGAFAQLAPGVDGLLTNGRLSLLAKGRRIASAHEVVEVDQVLEVKIDSLDVDQHKIALSPVVVVEAPTPAPVAEQDPDEDPQTWMRENRAKNAAMKYNPFAGLSL